MPPIPVPAKSPVNIAAFTLPLSVIFVVCIAHASAETSNKIIPQRPIKSKAVNGIIEVLGSIKATVKIDMAPIIPPIIIKIFRPYFPKKSTVGPKTNFIAQGTDAIPPTSVVTEIGISLSIKKNTNTTPVKATVKPSAKYKMPNKGYFKEGCLVRSSIG